MPPVKIIFDISTTARRSGPPAGISRVEAEFARYALANRPDIDFSFYDPAEGNFREVNRAWVAELIAPGAMLDTSLRPVAHRRKHKTSRLPSAAHVFVSWLARPRRRTQVALERVRMTGSSAGARALATRVLRLLRRENVAILPFDTVMGDFLEPDENCVLVSTGNDWGYKNVGRIAAMKERIGFRYVILCHDLIMIQFPELVGEPTASIVKQYWRGAFPLADLIVVTSRRVEDDVREYAAANALPPANIVRIPLGADPARFDAAGPNDLPAGIEPDRYILFVSSIAPRKGHDLLTRVWNRLYAEGVPQAQGVKLVFAGKILENLRNVNQLLPERRAGDTLVHLADVPDAMLAALYRNAGFCVYPSLYEGYGLPIVEAFSFGKPVIASTGGAVPEVVAGLSPCLDPLDDEAWYREIRQWIVDPSRREFYADKIRREFRMRSWQEAAADFFNAIGKWASTERGSRR